MELEACAHDLYLKYMDKKGNFSIVCHRVTDALKFLESREAEATCEGTKISVVDPIAYREWKGYKEFKK